MLNIQKKRTSAKLKKSLIKVQSNQSNIGIKSVQTIPRTYSSNVIKTGFNSLLKKADDSIRRSYQITAKPLTQQRDLNVTAQMGQYSYKKIIPEHVINETFNCSESEQGKLKKVVNTFKQFNTESKDFDETQMSVDLAEETEYFHIDKCNNSDKGTAVTLFPTY